jgi:NADH-quinone oxidoreductase subunit C
LSSVETPAAGSEADISTSTDTEIEAHVSADERCQRLLAILTEALGDAIVESEIRVGDVWVRVRPDAWRVTAEACKTALACDYFCFLSGLDWMPATAPNPEEAAATLPVEGLEPEEEPEAPEEAKPEASDGGESEGEGWATGYAGGDSRFQVFARYYSTTGHYGLTIKADLDDDNPQVESITEVYRGANWHERETWEMYGFNFVGHPNLTHLYLPGEFEGYPLRKDFPLLAREVKPWPGLVDIEPMTPEQEAAAEAALMASLKPASDGGAAADAPAPAGAAEGGGGT